MQTGSLEENELLVHIGFTSVVKRESQHKMRLTREANIVKKGSILALVLISIPI